MTSESKSTTSSEIIPETYIFEQLDRLGIGLRYRNARLDECRVKDELGDYCRGLQGWRGVGQGVLLSGPVGVGKTCALVVIVREVLIQYGRQRRCLAANGESFETGVWEFPSIVFRSSNKLFNAIFKKDQALIDRAASCEFLFIDDFGREYFHDFPFSEFEEIVDHRHSNMLPTYVSTNLSVKQLAESERFQRIVDRWRESCRIIQIGGKSMREKAT